jgi:hypothetical protein
LGGLSEMPQLPCQRRAASPQDAYAAHRFRAFAPESDIDLRDIYSFAPELAAIPPGLEWLRVASERFFIDRIVPQHESLQVVLREFPADVIVGDSAMFGCCRCCSDRAPSARPSISAARSSRTGPATTARAALPRAAACG